MKKAKVVLLLTALLFQFTLVAHAAKVKNEEGCVNLRVEPSINAEILECLETGSEVEPVRLPPTGRFLWVKDQVEPSITWWKVKVPNLKIEGWIAAKYINLDAK